MSGIARVLGPLAAGVVFQYWVGVPLRWQAALTIVASLWTASLFLRYPKRPQ